MLSSVIIACAILCAGCSGDAARDARASIEKNDAQRGVEGFMPEQVRIIYKRSCASCHGPDGGGITAIAPGLHRAKHRSAEEWDKYLQDSRDAHPIGYPPPLWLDADEMKTIAAYLDSLTQRNQ